LTLLTGLTFLATENFSTGQRFRAGEQRFVSVAVRYDQAKLAALERFARRIPGGLGRLVPPALNQTAAEMRTWLVRELGGRVRVTRKKSITDRVTVYPRASAGRWVSGVRVGLGRFTVASFPHHRTAYGVWWTAGAAGAGRIIPRAFVQAGYTHAITGERINVEQVYRRAQRGEKHFDKGRPTRRGDIVQRYPLKVLRGPSLAAVFSRDPGLVAEAERHGGAVLEKKIASQVRRFVVTEAPK
jgi:hypothetical protein